MEGCIAKTGDIYQVCVVVADLDQTMRNWIRYVDFQTDSIRCYPADLAPEGVAVPCLYKGQETESVIRAVRFDFATIEMVLVQPVHPEADDPFAAFLREKGNGYHHVAVDVSNLEEAVEGLARKGYHPMLRLSEGGLHHVMYDFRDVFGLIVDFTDGKTGPMARTAKPCYEPVDISRWTDGSAPERRLKFDLTMQIAMVTHNVDEASRALQTLVDGGEVFVDAEVSQALRAGEMTMEYLGVKDIYEYREQHMFWGNMDIEIFSPISKQSPNLVNDWYRDYGPGFQHMDMWLLDREESEAFILKELGITPFFEVVRPQRRCTYLDLRQTLGIIVELGPRIVGPRADMSQQQLDLMRD